MNSERVQEPLKSFLLGYIRTERPDLIVHDDLDFLWTYDEEYYSVSVETEQEHGWLKLLVGYDLTIQYVNTFPKSVEGTDGIT